MEGTQKTMPFQFCEALSISFIPLAIFIVGVRADPLRKDKSAGLGRTYLIGSWQGFQSLEVRSGVLRGTSAKRERFLQGFSKEARTGQSRKTKHVTSEVITSCFIRQGFRQGRHRLKQASIFALLNVLHPPVNQKSSESLVMNWDDVSVMAKSPKRRLC